MEIYYGLTILSIIIFSLIIKIEPRNLWSGISFVIMLLNIGGLAMIYYIKLSEVLDKILLLRYLLILLIIIVAVFIMFFPLIMIITFFINGIRVIKKEGRSLGNILSLLFSIGLFFYLTIWPYIMGVRLGDFGSWFYEWINLSVLYFLLLMNIFSVSNIVNLIHIKKNQKFKYVVILGAGLNKDKVTPLLKGRINKGIDIYKANKNCKMIFSGGKGDDELISEGEAMAKYAIDFGINKDDIIIENMSRNTKENIEYSSKLMEKDSFFAITTNSYHNLRALMYAKRLKLKCKGFGSHTKLYFTLNAFIREFIGFIYYTKKTQFCIIMVIGLILGVLNILNGFVKI